MSRRPASPRGRAWRRRCRGGGYGARSPPAPRHRSSLSPPGRVSASSWPRISALTAVSIPLPTKAETERRISASAGLSPGSVANCRRGLQIRHETQERVGVGALPARRRCGEPRPRSRACRRCAGGPAGRAAASRSRGGSPKSAPRSGSRSDQRRGGARQQQLEHRQQRLLAQRHRGAQQIEQQIQRGACEAADRPRRQLPDHRDEGRAQRQQRPDAGQLAVAAPAPESSLSTASARAMAAAVGQSVAPISRTTSPDIMLCPSASAPQPLCAVEAGRPAVTCSTSCARIGARKAAPAGPGLVRRDQQILEGQDQHPPQRQRPGWPQQRQPVAHRLQQPDPPGRADPACRSGRPRAAAARRWPATCPGPAPGKGAAPVMPSAARSSSDRARLSSTVRPGAPVLVQPHAAAAVEPDVGGRHRVRRRRRGRWGRASAATA